MDQLEYYMEEGQEEIAALLLVWSEVSLKLGDTQRGTAAQLQGVIFRLPDDCEAVIKEYNRIIGPKTRKTVDPLFEQWHWLARLTSDLPDSKRLVQKYPVFYKTVLPADAYKSDYTDHAAWCKAVHELNQNTYTALLSRWRKKHNRRRNLWRDMKAIGLSV